MGGEGGQHLGAVPWLLAFFDDLAGQAQCSHPRKLLDDVGRCRFFRGLISDAIANIGKLTEFLTKRYNLTPSTTRLN